MSENLESGCFLKLKNKLKDWQFNWQSFNFESPADWADLQMFASKICLICLVSEGSFLTITSWFKQSQCFQLLSVKSSP